MNAMKYKYFDLPDGVRSKVWDALVQAYKRRIPRAFEMEVRSAANEFLNKDRMLSKKEWLEVAESVEFSTEKNMYLVGI